MTESTIAYIGIGSNLGERNVYIEQAIEQMNQVAGITVIQVADIIETKPVGGPEQGCYLNTVAEIKTTLSPDDLLKILNTIEANLERVRTIRWGPRTIDLDIVAYGNEIVATETLQIPHPRMHERLFVLAPLQTIAPDWYHPILNLKIDALLKKINPD